MKGVVPEVKPREFLQNYLQEADERFQEVVRKRNATLPEQGTWEVALLLSGNIPAHRPNRGIP